MRYRHTLQYVSQINVSPVESLLLFGIITLLNVRTSLCIRFSVDVFVGKIYIKVLKTQYSIFKKTMLTNYTCYLTETTNYFLTTVLID
jgi:hypothetical protein